MGQTNSRVLVKSFWTHNHHILSQWILIIIIGRRKLQIEALTWTCGPRRERERKGERKKDYIGVQPLGGSCNYPSSGKGRRWRWKKLKAGFTIVSLRNDRKTGLKLDEVNGKLAISSSLLCWHKALISSSLLPNPAWNASGQSSESDYELLLQAICLCIPWKPTSGLPTIFQMTVCLGIRKAAEN